jgi:hypothetical protein
MTEPREHFPVATIEAEPGTKPTKYEGRYSSERGYEFAIVYVLEDGRRLSGHSHHQLLREAKAELASLPKAPKHPTAVQLDDEGAISMVRTSYRIGL